MHDAQHNDARIDGRDEQHDEAPHTSRPSSDHLEPRWDDDGARVVDGRYRLLETLGTGGMGVVHLAERVEGGPRVALKLLLPELLGDAVLCDRLRREAYAARRVRHPGVAEVLDAGEAGAQGPYVVFEHLAGEALAERLNARGCLAQREAVALVDAVLEVLEAVHAAGVVHRDVKPENIFLLHAPAAHASERPAVKLLDFGVARVTGEDETAPEGHADPLRGRRLTGAGVVVGTPVYMAPEQALGDPAQDARVDVYAAGVVLYEALSGRLPFAGDNPNQMLARALGGAFVPLTEQAPLVDPDLAAIVHRAIARRPEARYASAGAMRAALAAWRASVAPRETCATLSESEAARIARAGARAVVVAGADTTRPFAPVFDAEAAAARAEAAARAALESAVPTAGVARRIPARARRGGNTGLAAGALFVAAMLVAAAPGLRGGGTHASAAPSRGAAAPARSEPPPAAPDTTPACVVRAPVQAGAHGHGAVVVRPRARAATPARASHPALARRLTALVRPPVAPLRVASSAVRPRAAVVVAASSVPRRVAPPPARAR